MRSSAFTFNISLNVQKLRTGRKNEHRDRSEPDNLIKPKPEKSFHFNNLAKLAVIGLLRLLIRQFQICQIGDLGSARTQRNNLQSSQRFERQRHGIGATATQPEMCRLPRRLFIKGLAASVTRGDGDGHNLELKEPSFRI
jgi:hypothetical protein